MGQNFRSTSNPSLGLGHASDSLPGLPKRAMTPQQQTEALHKIQNQAEQRVKLGMQLFKAAEAKVAEQRDVLTAIKAHQKQLQDHVSEDVARTLQQYDQWMGQVDERFTQAMRDLEKRFEKLEASFNGSQQKIEKMMKRAESLFEQTRLLLSDVERKSPISRRTTGRPPRRQGPTIVDQAQAKFSKPQPPPPPPPQEVKPPGDKPAEAKTPSDATPPTSSVPTPPAEPVDDKIYLNLMRRLRQIPPDQQSPPSPPSPNDPPEDSDDSPKQAA